MSARQRLRLSQHVAATAAAVGIAAAVLAPAASAHDPKPPAPAPSHAAPSTSAPTGAKELPRYIKHQGKVYKVTTCQGGAYYCITKKGAKQPTWVIAKTDKKAAWLNKLFAKPVSWAVVKAPFETKALLLASSRCYRAVAWIWR
ncbi:hypothetical protein ACUN7V_08130 [Quadrisphaera oryzae]|uniref:hypothetical protein n=1 Tax=Quadrisphaera TaxID=317661 RepID=UPI001644EC3F|nr:hypothetical protein [Quadrisphaera sp. RL12-1S]MBC3761647.1 hypothetical protein [Quadrisphaera sp. RL12-1S]